MEFQLLVVRDDESGATHVFERLPADVRELLGEACQEHTFTFGELTEGTRQKAEALMWVPDPFSGVRYDPTLKRAAYCTTFLSAWTLDQPRTVEGFNSLPTGLGDAIAAHVMAKVEPNPAFFLLSKLRRGDGPASG